MIWCFDSKKIHEDPCNFNKSAIHVNAVLVFCRFSTQYCGIGQFFSRYCDFLPGTPFNVPLNTRRVQSWFHIPVTTVYSTLREEGLIWATDGIDNDQGHFFAWSLLTETTLVLIQTKRSLFCLEITYATPVLMQTKISLWTFLFQPLPVSLLYESKSNYKQ